MHDLSALIFIPVVYIMYFHKKGNLYLKKHSYENIVFMRIITIPMSVTIYCLPENFRVHIQLNN